MPYKKRPTTMIRKLGAAAVRRAPAKYEIEATTSSLRLPVASNRHETYQNSRPDCTEEHG
jgi:hypothetical protein